MNNLTDLDEMLEEMDKESLEILREALGKERKRRKMLIQIIFEQDQQIAYLTDTIKYLEEKIESIEEDNDEEEF